MGVRLAYTSVNICIHSSNVRQNRAVFGYVIDSIAQYGSGEPLGATGDASGGDVISFLLVLFGRFQCSPPLLYISLMD